MNAFRNIDSLLRVMAWGKDLLKFLFIGRKTPSLRQEQAVENFFSGDERRLNLLLDHGVVRLQDGVLVLEETYLRFFEEVLEVNEEINVQSVKQHIDTLNENIELWLTAGTEPKRFRYMGEILRILRNISLSTHRNVIDLKRNIDSTYKNERDYALKRKRLEILDRKRADIALLIKEAEKVIDERHPTFFGVSMDSQLKDMVTEVKNSLTESYHNLLELDRQIIQYLNRIEAEQKLVEKIRRIKYLKDQLVWEQATDVILFLQTHRPAFLEKRSWFNLLPSLEGLTDTPDGIAALKDAHKALRHPVARRKTEAVPLTAEELQPNAIVKDILNTFELRNVFLGGSQDLMSFIGQYRFDEPMSEEDRLTLFCRLAAEYCDDFRISEETAQTGNYSYPLIYSC
ncbi:MAG: hypothetical protein IJR77_02135 [Bacteroidales bacterium]|nr:hypothetical protein [Bacteroidales bacterium]